jgi:hypothetical protein
MNWLDEIKLKAAHQGYTGEPDLPLEEPWLNPVDAAAGGFAGGWLGALRKGLGMVPAVGRGLASGAVGAAADYPVGQVTDLVAEENPEIAFLTNLAAGLASGMTIERIPEHSLEMGLNLAKKYAGKSPQLQALYDTLANEMGTIGGVKAKTANKAEDVLNQTKPLERNSEVLESAIEKEEYFHGSPQPIEQINDLGRFGSHLFFSGRPDAASTHGEHLYKISMPDSDIIDASSLFYQKDSGKLSGFVEDLSEDLGVDEETAENLISQKISLYDVDGLDLDAEEIAEKDWDIQGITAKAAKLLGFRGVAVPDEYGTSYMVDMIGRDNELRPVQRSMEPQVDNSTLKAIAALTAAGTINWYNKDKAFEYLGLQEETDGI